jgi:hypothetical protein
MRFVLVFVKVKLPRRAGALRKNLYGIHRSFASKVFLKRLFVALDPCLRRDDEEKIGNDEGKRGEKRLRSKRWLIIFI